jgi:hypothetical protein
MCFFNKKWSFFNQKVGTCVCFSNMSSTNFVNFWKVCQIFYVKKIEKYPPPHMAYWSKKCPCERQKSVRLMLENKYDRLNINNASQACKLLSFILG